MDTNDNRLFLYHPNDADFIWVGVEKAATTANVNVCVGSAECDDVDMTSADMRELARQLIAAADVLDGQQR